VKPITGLVAATAIALVSLAALGVAPASAAPGDVYVAAADLTPTAAPPQAGWSYSTATSAPVSTPSGLAAAPSTRLFLGTGSAAGGLALADFAAGVALDPATAAGTAVFAIGLADAGGYREISSDASGAAALDPDATWSGGFFAGGLTLAQIDALLATTSPDSQIVGIGLSTASGAPFTLARLAAAGVVYAFTPVPTASVTPAAPTPLAFGTTGVTAAFTGLLPGAQVFAFLLPESGDPDDAVLIDQDLSADAAGSVTVTYVAATTATAPGGYSIVVGDGLDVVEARFSVVAAVVPAAPTPPGTPAPAAAVPPRVLAATGTDPAGVILAGGVLLLAGAGLALVATRRSDARALPSGDAL
jgi:hypothetical protein